MSSFVRTTPFEVRHYECDAHGWLRPAVILGYMQEAAFNGSAAVGWSATRYASEGYLWFAYETQLELLRPLRYGDVLHIRTWINDFRRVRSLRLYEFYQADDLVGFASTDWVFVTASTGTLAAIPPQIVDDFTRARGDVIPVPEARVVRVPFAPFPAAPAAPFTMTRRVEERDLDPAGHVNNAVYLAYAAEAERQARLAAGETSAPTQVYRLQIEYKLAAQLDDPLTLVTWIEPAQATTPPRRCTEIRRQGDGKLLARVQTETRTEG